MRGDIFTAADKMVLDAINGLIVVDDIDYTGLFDYEDEDDEMPARHST